MPTTILDGETYEQAKDRRFREEAEGYNDYCHERELIRWAYSKIHCFSFVKIEDALMLDDMRLYLEEK